MYCECPLISLPYIPHSKRRQDLADHTGVGIVVSLIFPFIHIWLISGVSIVEMTAGIMVCCMPTANIVWNHIQGIVGPFITASARAITTISSRKSAEKHESLGSTSNLRPDTDKSSYQARIVPGDKLLPVWSKGGNDSGDWLRDRDSPYSFPLDNIRKTTEIEVA